MNAILRIIAALAILLVGTALVFMSAMDQRTSQAPLPPIDPHGSAVIVARRALIRSPLDDRAFEWLVRADDAAGRWDEEKRLIALSPRLTRRNLPILFMALATASAHGEIEVAARYADLLLRQHAYEEQGFSFVRDASAFPEGRDAIARRLAAHPPWREDLLVRQRGLTPAGYADAVALLTAMKPIAPPTPDETESLAAPLLAAGDVESAFALRAAFTRPGDNLLIDGDFSRYGSSPSGLLGWSSNDGIKLDRSPGLPIGGPDGGAAARQVTFADPGRHDLRWTILGSGGDPRVEWTIRCLGAQQTPLAGPVAMINSRGKTVYRRQIDIPDGCSTQLLSVATDATTTRTGETRLLKAEFR